VKSSTSVTCMTLCGAFINVITGKLNMIAKNIRYDCGCFTSIMIFVYYYNVYNNFFVACIRCTESHGDVFRVPA
jgi:hypothetical protein